MTPEWGTRDWLNSERTCTGCGITQRVMDFPNYMDHRKGKRYYQSKCAACRADVQKKSKNRYRRSMDRDLTPADAPAEVQAFFSKLKPCRQPN